MNVHFVRHVKPGLHRLVVNMDDAEAAMFRGIVHAMHEQFGDAPPAAGAPVPAPRPPRPNVTRETARKLGYEGDPCPDCGQFMLTRNGTCLKCDGCGATTGCS